jgi:hypothetical protein
LDSRLSELWEIAGQLSVAVLVGGNTVYSYCCSYCCCRHRHTDGNTKVNVSGKNRHILVYTPCKQECFDPFSDRCFFNFSFGAGIMSYSLSVASTYKVTWTGGWFNYRVDEFEELLDSIPGFNYVFPDDNHDDVEIAANKENLDILRKYIRALGDDADTVHPCFPEVRDKENCVSKDAITKGDVAEYLTEILDLYDHDNDVIILSWS